MADETKYVVLDRDGDLRRPAALPRPGTRAQADEAVARAERELDAAAVALAKGVNATLADSERYVNARNAYRDAVERRVRAAEAGKYAFAVLSASTLGGAREAVERFARAAQDHQGDGDA